ncbi:hypothetical protein QN277_020666 [Acacia crassicarpa]|uniref:Cation/H+ exchanger domain-containing protein n=1 Tax=Acacia crassicarpa TaxID=499986 RepID=A0AAE1MSU0_9FABA|nr:hypothetical protein QN277_020666 [Acacia crassicarpa]
MNPNETLFTQVDVLSSSPVHTIYNVCINIPPRIASDGIWGSHRHSASPLKASYPIFELQVIVIFAITHALHFLFKRLGFPLFFSQMMAGFILGPSIHFEQLDKYKKLLFPYGSQDTLATISSLGYALFIFLYGVQMDFSMILRTGRKSWIIGFTGLIFPIGIGYLMQFFVLKKALKAALGDDYPTLPTVFVSHSVTSFAVVAAFLNDLKLLNSELGRLALSSALVSDVLSTSFTSFATAIISSKMGRRKIYESLGSLIAAIIFIPLVFRPTMLWIVRNTPEGRPVKQVYIYNIVALLFGLCWLLSRSDQAFALGAFILGLSVPEGPPLGSSLVSQLELIGKSFLLPIFVTTSVMKADLSSDSQLWSFLIIGSVVCVIHTVKISACILPSLYCKMPFKDAMALALIMNCKGVVDVGNYNSVYDRKQMHAQTYGVMMVSVMAMATFVQIAVKCLYDPARKYAGFQKRNIMNLKPNSDLRMVVCIHKQHHIAGILHFLDLCCPTPDFPLVVDALHLIELVGRYQPIFISHHLQKDSDLSLANSYSENVFMSFQNYEHSKTPGAVSTHTYTAISPFNYMREDVCYLALDKLASIIILPFHRRWSIDGSIESEDKNIRSLNSRVLEGAPCSVGILVNRASLPSEPHMSLQLAVIFFGGKDDREALCLAKRVCINPHIRLVVYHLPENDNSKSSTLEKLLDNAVLKDVMDGNYGSRVSFKELVTEGGSDIASVVRDLVDDHDFFIVGRRHDVESSVTSGLKDWCEFEELGVIGDLLASPDFESSASVLVVQQQVVK